MTFNQDSNYNYLLRYIIIGDQAVGKSNLLLRYAYGQFKQDYHLTIGVEFGSNTVQLGNKKYRIQIWDTAGQENYRSITRSYYSNCVCAIVVYDITTRDSFNNVSTWVEDCKNNSPKTVFMVLVGNKSDLAQRRQVNTEEGQDFADKNGMLFYETSAKTGENVEKIFVDSVNEIKRKIEEGYYNLEDDSCGIKKGIKTETETIKINQVEKKEKKKKKFC